MNLHFVLMSHTKYPLNPRSVSGEEAESQFTRWPPCHYFTKFVSTQCTEGSHQA